MQVTNWTEFFKVERDIYVQNISATQISMEFREPSGEPVPVLIKNTRDPVNLTDLVPYSLIKANTKFRTLINRRPPVAILLSEEEYIAYYEKKAELEGDSDVSDVMARSAHAATTRDSQTPSMLDPVTPLRTEGMGANERARTLREAARGELPAEFQNEEDTINPRLLHIRQMVTKQGNETDADIMGRFPPQRCMNEIQGLGELSADDYNFILASVPYKTIRKWAQGELQRLTGAGEIDDEAVIEPAPAPLAPDGGTLEVNP